jgi:hypothetical protein
MNPKDLLNDSRNVPNVTDESCLTKKTSGFGSCTSKLQIQQTFEKISYVGSRSPKTNPIFGIWLTKTKQKTSNFHCFPFFLYNFVVVELNNVHYFPAPQLLSNGAKLLCQNLWVGRQNNLVVSSWLQDLEHNLLHIMLIIRFHYFSAVVINFL